VAVVVVVLHVVQDKVFMKKLLLFYVSVLTVTQMHAQIYSYPNLARQFSSSYATGSARMQGLGGSFGVLGADLSSIAGNPAGLGFYTRSEVGMNFGILDAQTTSNYPSVKYKFTHT
jgi:hypothetical protein